MDSHLSYILHPGVFYRQLNHKTFLYHTAKRQVFTFNEIAFDIFNYYSQETENTTLAEYLTNIYSVNDNSSFENDIESFLSLLIREGILISKEHDNNQDVLEGNIIKEYSKSTHLFSVSIELTYSCNESCRHCYISDEKGDLLTTDEIKRIMDDLHKMGAFHILFTGGEVMIRNDIFEILEYAYQKHFLFDIFTNGTLLTPTKIMQLKNLWPRCIHFSLYSNIPEKHDAITMVKGSFDKTLEAIRLCKAMGIQVNIKSPIFDETKNDVKGLFELANRLDVPISVTTLIIPKKNGDQSPLKMSITDPAELEAISDMVNPTNRNTDTCNRDTFICNAGQSTISINPYGRVFLCCQFPLEIGNLRNQNINEIWNGSDKLNWWREQNQITKKEECIGCKHFYECKFCPGQAYTRKGNPTAKYQEACTATDLYYRNPNKSASNKRLN